MPRKGPDEREGKVIHATMTLKPSAVKQYIEEIEELQAEMDAIGAQAVKRKAPKAQAIAKLKKQAAEDGIPKTELAAALKRRRLLRRADECDSELDDEQKENYRKIVAAAPWAGTPLAQAAE
jgi:hypothetical protein